MPFALEEHPIVVPVRQDVPARKAGGRHGHVARRRCIDQTASLRRGDSKVDDKALAEALHRRTLLPTATCS
jgi:hypothetical protein